MAKGILQTVDRALNLLEIISEHSEGLTTKEIEKILEINNVAVHRLLTTLENRSFVERIGNKYTIGLKMVELSSMKLNKIELKTEAAPYLRELINIVKQPVQMAILDDLDAVFIEKMQSVNNLRMYSQIGRRIPLYCSGVGKALLLEKSDEEIIRKLSKRKFEKFTHNTLETPDQVLKEIQKARETGYTTDNQEHERGVFCVAVPIYDYRGKTIAAISTAGMNKEFIDDSNTEIQDLIKMTGYNISKRLGYGGRL